MSGVPHLLTHLHKNLQRTASVAFCTSRAPKSRRATAIQLADAYREPLERRVAVPSGGVERMRKYLVGKGLAASMERASTSKQPLDEQLATGSLKVETQDWFLSDPLLPSSTGREHKSSYAATAAACAELRLLSDRTLNPEPYGQLIIALAEDRGLLRALEDLSGNPFAPDPWLGTAVLFQLLTCDFAFQRELVEWMPKGSSSLTQDLAPSVGALLRAVKAWVPATAANRVETLWLERHIEKANVLRRRIGRDKALPGSRHDVRVAPQTLYRSFEDILLPRIEFLVDCGLIRKPAGAENYTYEPTEGFAVLRELTRRGPQAIESDFFHTVARMRGCDPSPLTDALEIAEHLRPATVRLRGLTGYAGIVEATVYANVSSFAKTWRFAEITQSQEALRTLASAERPKARVIADRTRKPRDFALLS